jgi:hypothetical protein
MPRRNDRILQKYVSCHRNLISSSAKKEVYYDSYSTYRRQRRIIRGGALSVRFFPLPLPGQFTEHSFM